jgi:hypothetical protein
MTEVERALADARAAGKFMVGVWFVDPAGQIHLRRTTWTFPREDLRRANELLENQIDAELSGQEIEAPPLPVANLFDFDGGHQ